MGYLRTNYRNTGSHIATEIPRPYKPGAVMFSAADKALYIYMSGATWLVISRQHGSIVERIRHVGIDFPSESIRRLKDERS